MAKLVSCAVVLLAAMQAGCAASPVHPVGRVYSLEPVHPTCDTSVGYVQLLGELTNHTGGAIDVHLDDFEGPPFDPAHMAYRVYAGAPGGPLELVHNSGHDSIWDRTITIAPGESAMLNIPIFGLRPADYYHYFRVEYRDARNRSFWTPEFTLCAVAPLNCRCPGAVATAAGAKSPASACPMVASSSALGPGAREISLMCR